MLVAVERIRIWVL